MQKMIDAGNEGCWKGGRQERRGTGNEGFMKGIIKERWDSGKVICRTGGMK